LVNVLLVPVTIGAAMLGSAQGLEVSNPDAYHFLWNAGVVMNIWLLIFNILPIYPLDGGQILQALLWFVVGQARSLMVAGRLGRLGAAGVIALALFRLQDQWLAFLALFIAWQAWNGFRLGIKLQKLQPTIELMSQA